MTNNYILSRISRMLRMDAAAIADIFGLADQKADQAVISAMLKKEDEWGYVACSDQLIGAFLDGLIIQRRGKKEGAGERPAVSASPITNNEILKKLRIAFNLKEDEMLAVLKLGSVEISASELSALFRKPGHKNYKECGDQFLRYFLKGLGLRFGH